MNKCTFYLAIVFTSAIESRKCTVLARTILEEGVSVMWSCGAKSEVRESAVRSQLFEVIPDPVYIWYWTRLAQLAWRMRLNGWREMRGDDMMGVMLLWVITIWCNCRAEAVLRYYIIKQYHQMCAFIQSYVVLYARSPPTFRNFQVRSKRTHSTLTGHLISPSSSGNGKYSGKRRTIIIISLYVTISIYLHNYILTHLFKTPLWGSMRHLSLALSNPLFFFFAQTSS